jgi:hypothetical protein
VLGVADNVDQCCFVGFYEIQGLLGLFYLLYQLVALFLFLLSFCLFFLLPSRFWLLLLLNRILFFQLVGLSGL